MRHLLLITAITLLSPALLPAQDLEFVSEECSDECPSYEVLDVYEIFKVELFQAFEDSESGTVNAHEEGGWIVQTREKQEDGCYRYCTQLYRVSSGQECFFATDTDDPAWCSLKLNPKPKEDENTRVVANFHTHPIIFIEIKDILNVDDSTDLVDGNMEFNGYDFPDIEYDHPDFEYNGQPSEGDQIGSVDDGVPGIIIASDGSNESIPDGTAYGYKEYEKDEDGEITGAQGLVLEPLKLRWECEACLEISPVKECLETEETTTLQASVKGPENKKVNWEAQEGIIDDNGNYQAPSFAGLDFVIATSVADEAAKDTILVQVGCDCEWKATLSGDINGEYEGEIAAYQEESEGQLRMFFFTASPTENDYPRLGLLNLSVPTGPGTFEPKAFSITLGPDDLVLSGGSEFILSFVQLIVENIVGGVIQGRIEGRILGVKNDDIVEADINMTFRARLKGEGTSNPCSF